MKLVYIFVLAFAVGCGGSGKAKVFDVSGMVTMDAKPLAGAEIKLISDKVTGFGRTGAEGKFQLVQGVPAGTYKVVISKIEGKPAQKLLTPAEEALDDGQKAAIEFSRTPSGEGALVQGPKETVPADFSNFQQTKLTLDVPTGGTTTADFKLTSQ